MSGMLILCANKYFIHPVQHYLQIYPVCAVLYQILKYVIVFF